MKYNETNRGGFITITVIFGIILIIGVAGYFILNQQIRLPAFIPLSTPQISPTQSASEFSTLNLDSVEKMSEFKGAQFRKFDVFDNTMYIATEGGFVVISDNKKQSIFPRLNRGTSNNDIWRLAIDKNKIPWICYGSYEPQNLAGANSYWYTAHLKDGGWIEHDITKLVDSDNRCNFVIDDDNGVFLITGLGIYKFRGEQWEAIYSEEKQNYLENVDYVALDKERNFYMSSFLRVNVFSKEGVFIKELIRQKSTNTETPEKIVVAPDDTIWLKLRTSSQLGGLNGAKLVYFKDGAWNEFERNKRGAISDFAISKYGEMVIVYENISGRNVDTTLSYYDGNIWSDFNQPNLEKFFSKVLFDENGDHALYVLTFIEPAIYKIKRY